MSFILGIITCLITVSLFTLLRSFILKKITTNRSNESFDLVKFLSGFELFDWKLWAKSFHFFWRHLVFVSIIIGVIYAYGYWKGIQNAPATLDLHGKDVFIQLNDHFLHIKKDGSAEVVDKDRKTVLKTIRVKDIPELRKILKPYGFQFKPVGILGLGISEDKNWEGGAGISFLKYWQWRLDTFLTNKGIYLGTSYKLEKLGLNNSFLGIGAGKGYKGDNRILFYYKWEF